jgi:hypothetical protein
MFFVVYWYRSLSSYSGCVFSDQWHQHTTEKTYYAELEMRAIGNQQVPAFYGFLLKVTTRSTRN